MAEELAVTATANSESIPSYFIAGIRIDPTAEASAVADPEIPENNILVERQEKKRAVVWHHSCENVLNWVNSNAGPSRWRSKCMMICVEIGIDRAPVKDQVSPVKD